MTPAVTAQKVCTLCLIAKPLDGFHKQAKAKDGRQSRCRSCACAVAREWAKTNAARVAANGAKYYQMNREAKDAYAKSWAAKNLEKRREHARKWAAKNPEKMKANGLAWRKDNSALLRKRYSYRRAVKSCAMPSWATEKGILDFYITAEALGMHTGDHYEVDHIVPLQSKIVCGLHCEANLQVLPRSDNRSKSNRHWPDMP